MVIDNIMACCMYECICHKQRSMLMRIFLGLSLSNIKLNYIQFFCKFRVSFEQLNVSSVTRHTACLDHLVSRFCRSASGLCRGPAGPLTIIFSMSSYLTVNRIRRDRLINHLASIWQVKNSKSERFLVLDATDFSWCWSFSRPCFNMLCIPNNYLPKRSNRFTL